MDMRARTPRSVRRRSLWFLLLLVVTAGGTLAIPRLRRQPAPPPIPTAVAPDLSYRSSLGILPWSASSERDDERTRAAAVQEDVRRHLSAVPGLTIITPLGTAGPAVAPDATTFDVAAGARDLGMGSVVRGDVRTEGDRSSVRVRLVDARDGTELRAIDREVPTAEIGRLGREVAAEIAGALLPDFEPAVLRDSAEPFDDLERYDLLTRVRSERLRDPASRDLDALDRRLRSLADRDPTDAPVLLERALNFLARGGDFRSRDMADSAAAYARRAAEAGTLSGARAALGEAERRRGHMDRAAVELAAALAADPNAVDAQVSMGDTELARGRIDRALVRYWEALRRSPSRDDIRVRMAHAYRILGELDTAERWFDEAWKGREPSAGVRQAWALSMNRARGRSDVALRLAERLAAERPEDGAALTLAAEAALDARAYGQAVRFARSAILQGFESTDPIGDLHPTTLLGIALHRIGGRTEGDAHLRRSLDHVRTEMERGARWPTAPLEMAAIHEALGDRNAAIEWTRRAVDAGDRSLLRMTGSPLFDGLRDDPSFRDEIVRMSHELTLLRRAAADSLPSATPSFPSLTSLRLTSANP